MTRKQKKSRILAPHQSGRSPIDLDDKIVYPKKTPPLLLNGHWLNDGEATLSNNGRTASVYLCGNRIPSWISGGPLLQDVYDFHHVHFHWGKDNCFGCEHTINGTWFSMEAHAVHWNRKYFTFEAALQQKDGLCVLGYLFLATSTWPHPLLEKITDNLKHIVDPGKDVKIPPNCLSWMRSAIFCEGYYFYHGSLTQDPERTSTDCVLWVVFPTILRISTSQVEEFRKLKNIHGESIMANCTSVQPLRGRKIFWAIN
ncbi:carbonic anhydrase 2 [Orussus abietinus]|uniref:carbonic anhydrase 2 n=1 Tax=Orussus abietinus TaxID=222816 RepID=UPI0006254320|nr:carbonic anhydrase 2 [Orussus abietinus]